MRSPRNFKTKGMRTMSSIVKISFVIATLFGALPILVADVSGREEFDGLSGADTWAGRKSHPARVNSVMDASSDSNLISLT